MRRRQHKFKPFYVWVHDILILSFMLYLYSVWFADRVLYIFSLALHHKRVVEVVEILRLFRRWNSQPVAQEYGIWIAGCVSVLTTKRDSLHI